MNILYMEMLSPIKCVKDLKSIPFFIPFSPQKSPFFGIYMVFVWGCMSVLKTAEKVANTVIQALKKPEPSFQIQAIFTFEPPANRILCSLASLSKNPPTNQILRVLGHSHSTSYYKKPHLSL